MTCFGSFSETSHGDPALLARPLRAARGRDRPGHRLQAGRPDRGGGGRRPARGVPPGRRLPAPPRPGGRGDLPGRDERPVPLGEDRRPARRLPRPRRRPGQPRRPDHRARQGRPAARRTGPRGRHGHRRRHRDPRARRERDRRPGGRVSTRARKLARLDHRILGGVRVRRQRDRHVGPRARAEVGPQRAEHVGRALLPDHRHHRRPRPGHPGLRGPRRPRLLPRGGRRDDGRPLRAARGGVAPRGRAGRVVVHQDPARLGPDGPVPGDRDVPGAGDAGGRRPHVLLRARSRSRPTWRRSSARRRAPAATSWPPA